jgi:hypothetical protein
MNVVCINDQWVPDTGLENIQHPRVGDYDTVTDQIEEEGTLYIYYRLERFGKPWYRASHFVTLPDTPSEVIEEKKPEYATA